MVRRGRSGGMGGGINLRYLSQVMDSCGKDLATAEEIVDDLHSRYGNFARLTRQVLLLNVRHVLSAQNNNNKRVKALSLVTPSVSKQQIKHYEELRKKLQSTRINE